MNAEVQQWVALFRDHELGVDVPVRVSDGQPMIWVARDREGAIVQIRAALHSELFALCQVFSMSEPRFMPHRGYERVECSECSGRGWNEVELRRR